MLVFFFFWAFFLLLLLTKKNQASRYQLTANLHFNVDIFKRPKMSSQVPLLLDSVPGRSPFNFKGDFTSKQKKEKVDEYFGKVLYL